MTRILDSFATSPAVLVLFALCVVLLFVAVFKAGQASGWTAREQTLTPALPAPVAVVPVRSARTPHPGIAELHAAQRDDRRADSQNVVLRVRNAQLELRNNALELKASADVELITSLRGKLKTANRLRVKWYRLWRVERERVRYAFGDLYERRKLTRKKLAAVVIESPVSTETRPIPLVPPVIAHEWAA